MYGCALLHVLRNGRRVRSLRLLAAGCRAFTSSAPPSSSAPSSPSTAATYDVCVIGGGGAGAALACALPESLSLRTLILDGASLPTLGEQSAAPSPRVLAISPATVSLLERCEVWNTLLATERVRPYRHMRVWDASAGGALSFDGEPMRVASDWLAPSPPSEVRGEVGGDTKMGVSDSECLPGSGVGVYETTGGNEVQALGYVVENHMINAALADCARGRTDIDVR
jgi:hypothetical protein